MLVDWGSWNQRAARVAPRDNVEVPSHPGRIGYHPLIRNPSISVILQQTVAENGDPLGRYRPARCGNPNLTGHWRIAYGSWGQRAARVSPRDNIEVPPHPLKIGSHPRIRNPTVSLQLTATIWGRKRGSPGSIPLRTVWKPHPHCLVGNWLALMEPAGGESCLSGQGPIAGL